MDAKAALMKAFVEAEVASRDLMSTLSNDQKLQMYALHKQATVGNNESPKPSTMDVAGTAKWTAWHNVLNLTREEAARLYVSLVSSLVSCVPSSDQYWPSDTTPIRTGHEFSLQSLESHLQKSIPTFPGHLLSVRQFKHGQSNPTFYLAASSNASHPVNLKEYVLRKKPPGKILPSAHAVEREFQIISALGRDPKHSVPVPEAYVLCHDSNVIGTPFYVMQFVRGRIFKDPSLPGMSPSDRGLIYQEMIRVLAAIHTVNWAAVGLSSYGKTDSYVTRNAQRWSQQYAATKTHEIPSMDSLSSFLVSHVPSDADADPSTPADQQIKRISIVHGDYRLDNLIFHPTELRVVAVLDWELSTLGNPLSELAFSCMPYHSTPDFIAYRGLLGQNLTELGIPNERTFVQKYCVLTGRSSSAEGVDTVLSQFSYYLALSFFRAAAILQGVYKRSLMGNASSEQAKTVGALAKYVADAGWAHAQGKCAQTCGKHSASSASSTKKKPSSSLMEKLPFTFSAKAMDLERKLLQFMDDYVIPAEKVYEAQTAPIGSPNRWKVVPHIVEELKEKAKAQGLWNLFLPAVSGLSVLEYAPLAEIMGRSAVFGPEVFNCNAPDTGNMEILHMFATPEQRTQWLNPLLEGKIRSCFCMTEPEHACSDATNVRCSIERQGEEYVINGRKWWATGAGDPRCKLAIVMGRTNPSAPKHKQQSMVLVPMEHPGVKIVRPLTVFGYDDAPHGHMEIVFENVRVPVSNLLLGEGRGFEIAQARLGPGRVHHCMRSLGVSERCLELMCQRVQNRTAFGTKLSEKGTILRDIADSRIELNQARMLVLHCAWAMDKFGAKGARQQIAAIKVAAPRAALKVIDRAIQAHGAYGVGPDSILPHAYASLRTLRIADGPDEVHLEQIAKMELAHQNSKL